MKAAIITAGSFDPGDGELVALRPLDLGHRVLREGEVVPKGEFQPRRLRVLFQQRRIGLRVPTEATENITPPPRKPGRPPKSAGPKEGDAGAPKKSGRKAASAAGNGPPAPAGAIPATSPAAEGAKGDPGAFGAPTSYSRDAGFSAKRGDFGQWFVYDIAGQKVAGPFKAPEVAHLTE